MIKKIGFAKAKSLAEKNYYWSFKKTGRGEYFITVDAQVKGKEPYTITLKKREVVEVISELEWLTSPDYTPDYDKGETVKES